MEQPRDNREEARRRLRARNLALFLALLAFALIVYVVSIVRLGGQ